MDWGRVIVGVFNCILEMALAAFFFSAFQRRRVSKKILVLVVIAAGAADAALPMVLRPGHAVFLTGMVLTFFVALCFRFNWPNALFMTAVISVLAALAELLASVLLAMGDKSIAYTQDNIYAYIILILMSKSLTGFVALIVHRGRHHLFQSARGNHFFGILLLPMASILIMLALNDFLKQYDAPDTLKILSIIAVVFLLLANIAIFYVIDRQYELIRTRQKLKMSGVLMENQRAYYDKVFASQQEIRQMRHNLKNSFIAVLATIDAGNIEEARRMVQSQLSDTERNIDFSSRECDNIMNPVIYSKKVLAQERQVVLEPHVSVRGQVHMDSLDLAVLLANLLDNAIEAAARLPAEQERRIVLTVKADQNNLLISTENPVLQDVDVHHIETIKSDKKNHGFGLLSIKAIVEKYHGMHTITCENRIFSYTAVIPNIE